MSKIFRLYKEGTSTYQDWNNSPAFPYNSTNRQSIEDPEGASAKNEITSIPSPFARIDLVKNAFREVCKPDKSTHKPDLDGQTIFHKMVSDTLDVAEIFFNLNKYKGKIEILKWDKGQMLSELEQDSIAGHAYLADALKKYLVSDGRTYNFDRLQSIYLLNYVDGPEELNIIGATSPATLFFCNANDLSYVNDIYFGDDRPFDAEYQPLYKRDFEFIKYLFALRQNIPDFAGTFPEVEDYLVQTYKLIKDPEKKNELNNLTPTSVDDFDELSVKNHQQNDLVEVLGFTLYQKSNRPVGTASDFIIATNKNIDQKPLALPVEAGNRYSELKYTTAKWGNTNKAPFFDSEADLSRRVLPFDGAQSPYLTISDFLEDSIVCVPHTLNIAHYYAGGINVDEPELAYLLPIKPLFFKFFTIEELKGSMRDGRPMFEMGTRSGGAVSVTLRIPIKGNGTTSYIEYSRLYYSNNSADTSINKGNVVEMKFTGFIMPQIHFNNPEEAIYNISCIQSSAGKTDFIFYLEDEKVNPNSKTCRNQQQGYQLLTKADNYLLKGKLFDYIQVCNHHGYKGLLIPEFKPQLSVEAFEFAIDLGTSNTHIEYRKDSEKARPFAFSVQDRQLCEMFLPSVDETGTRVDLIEETEIIEKDYIPASVGEGDYYFPTRTVLSCAKTIDWNETIDPFTLVNLPFTYDKRADLIYNNQKYNIKWGNGDEGRLMQAYVRSLMLIIRNKVLLNNGDLARTKITWFYPISMAPRRLRVLRETWDEAYREYFGEGATSNMTESEAPIQYFFSRYSTATTLVNVDIGGGTTDIAFAKDRRINYVTSFRFASNSLFENPFSEINENNAIVDSHKGKILKLLQDKNLGELVRVFNSANNQKPSNMASFLFGLKDNTLPQQAGLNPKVLDFNKILQDDEDFKIVFILFYTSIIYHIAQITKHFNLDTPRHISFSGNGSKVISIITSDVKILTRYTKIIFEKVLGKPYGKELELLGLGNDSNPKSSTCKGALYRSERDGQSSPEDNDELTVVFKSDCSGVVGSDDTYASIDAAYKTRTVNAVKDFLKFTLEDMNTAFNFDKYFGVTNRSLSIAREASGKDLATYLDKGLQKREEETDLKNIIEETFFFYPIQGAIQAISNDIAASLKQDSYE